MNSWQTFLASIRLSLPEISSFQRNINFYLKYPDIRSSHAPRHNRPIASPRATCAAHCTVATFFLSFFCYRAARVYGEGKKCGSRRLGPFIGPISFRVSVGNKDRRFEDRIALRSWNFYLIHEHYLSLNEIFSRLEVWNRTIHVIHVR